MAFFAPKGARSNSRRGLTPHSRRVHRRVPILASRPLYMEIILAICVAFRSDRVSRRLFATVCVGSENFDRRCPAFLRREAYASPKRSAGNVRSVAANGD